MAEPIVLKIRIPPTPVGGYRSQILNTLRYTGWVVSCTFCSRRRKSSRVAPSPLLSLHSKARRCAMSRKVSGSLGLCLQKDSRIIATFLRRSLMLSFGWAWGKSTASTQFSIACWGSGRVSSVLGWKQERKKFCFFLFGWGFHYPRPLHPSNG